MKYRSEVIKHTELDKMLLFKRHYLMTSKNVLELDYLKKTRIRVFYDRKTNEFIAGYLINVKPPFRYFLPLKPEEIEQLKIKMAYPKVSFMEPACAWVYPEYRKRGFLFFYLLMVLLDIMKTNEKKMLAGTHSYGIKKSLEQLLPKELYNKKIFVPSMQKECPYWLYYGGKRRFIFNVLKLVIQEFYKGLMQRYRS